MIKTACCFRFVFTPLAILLLILGTGAPAYANPILAVVLTLGAVALPAIGLSADLVTLFGLTESSHNVPAGTTFTQTVSGSETNLSLTFLWIGPLDDGDVILPFKGTAFGQTTTSTGGTAISKFWSWEVGFILLDDEGVFPALEEDVVQIVGLIQHEIGPHTGDDVQGPQLTFDLSAQTRIAPFQKTATGAGKQLDHPPSKRDPQHVDRLPVAFLSGTVNHVNAFHHELTGFTFRLVAEHACLEGSGSGVRETQQLGECPCECPSVPAPPALLLFSMGIVVLGMLLVADRRRARMR